MATTKTSTADTAADTAADPWFQDLFAQRIGGAGYGKGNEIYKFELIKRAKRQAMAEHPERRMLDFGIGENDEMAPENVRSVMKREVDRPENRGYADNGIAAYKEAVATFMQREFGVSLDPVKEINHCIGSKTAYAMLPAAFIDPGDVTLMTVPGYPVAGTATRWFGGVVHRLVEPAAFGRDPREGLGKVVLGAAGSMFHWVTPDPTTLIMLIVAGLIGANALVGEPLSKEKLLELAIDIEGHPEDANVKLALEELAYFTSHLQILGVYPADRRRG